MRCSQMAWAWSFRGFISFSLLIHVYMCPAALMFVISFSFVVHVFSLWVSFFFLIFFSLLVRGSFVLIFLIFSHFCSHCFSFFLIFFSFLFSLFLIVSHFCSHFSHFFSFLFSLFLIFSHFFLIFVLIVSHFFSCFSHCCLIFLVWRFHRVNSRGIFLTIAALLAYAPGSTERAGAPDLHRASAKTLRAGLELRKLPTLPGSGLHRT